MWYLIGLVIFTFSFYRLIANLGYKTGYAWGPIDEVLMYPSYLVVMAILYFLEGLRRVIEFFIKEK